MNNIEFLKFDLTPIEKHVGIATIRYEKKIILRFKIMQNPKGEGFFMNPPSIKLDDAYFPAFQLDSTYESDQIKAFVMSHVKTEMQKGKSVHPTCSLVFDSESQQSQFSFNDPIPF